LILCCLLCVAVHAKNEDLSYAALGNDSIPENYFSLLEELPSLNSSTQPWEVHTLRKNIGYFRDLLDMFVYAFNNCTGDSCTDLWGKLRKDVNDGYTLIGNYQDLNHSGVNYTNAQRIQLLDVCLSWLDNFTKDMKTYDYASVVWTADPNAMFVRPKSKLSPYFWGQVVPIPDLAITGLQNLAILEYALSLESVLNYTTVMTLPEVYTTQNHSIFHGYRKLSRSILSIATYSVFDKLSCTENALAIVLDMYNNFGNLNDEVTAYQIYKENGEQEEEQEEKVIVIAGWAQLQKWMDSISWLQQMECLMISVNLPDPLNPYKLISRN